MGYNAMGKELGKEQLCDPMENKRIYLIYAFLKRLS